VGEHVGTWVTRGIELGDRGVHAIDRSGLLRLGIGTCVPSGIVQNIGHVRANDANPGIGWRRQAHCLAQERNEYHRGARHSEVFQCGKGLWIHLA
jgi:hypothetical protein